MSSSGRRSCSVCLTPRLSPSSPTPQTAPIRRSCCPTCDRPGKRSPFLDTTVRGSVLGLDIERTRADVALGIIEGLSFLGTRLPRRSRELSSIALSGGGSNSTFWCRTIADVIGAPVRLSDTTEVGALGAVLAGLSDLGSFDDGPALRDEAAFHC